MGFGKPHCLRRCAALPPGPGCEASPTRIPSHMSCLISQETSSKSYAVTLAPLKSSSTKVTRRGMGTSLSTVSFEKPKAEVQEENPLHMIIIQTPRRKMRRPSMLLADPWRRHGRSQREVKAGAPEGPVEVGRQRLLVSALGSRVRSSCCLPQWVLLNLWSEQAGFSKQRWPNSQQASAALTCKALATLRLRGRAHLTRRRPCVRAAKAALTIRRSRQARRQERGRGALQSLGCGPQQWRPHRIFLR